MGVGDAGSIYLAHTHNVYGTVKQIKARHAGCERYWVNMLTPYTLYGTVKQIKARHAGCERY